MRDTRSALLGLLVSAAAVSLGGCDGAPTDPDGGGPGMDGEVGGECDGATDGDACGDGSMICVGGACAASACGDGFVDEAAGEVCDDGNTTAFDGCEPGTCTFTCTSDETCADDDPCNGAESCDPDTHACVSGSVLADGDACSTGSITDGVCRSETCVPAGCGNGVVESGEDCDDGNDVADDGCEIDCTFSCAADADCADGVFCNGVEVCNPTTHACEAGAAVTCTPSDACHASTCEEASGACVETLIDADGDGHAPTSLGACGTDCDDTRSDVNPDETESCNGTDNDCNGSTGIEELAPTWYVDCDGDGFAASTDSSRQACSEPSPSAAGCSSGGGWTMLRPTDASTTDCDDLVAAMNPGATEVPGDAGDLDEDCSGSVACFRNADGDSHRTATVIDGGASCTGSTEAYASVPSGDCCDTDARVFPGQSTCFSTTTNCVRAGNYDYNCSGASTTCLSTTSTITCPSATTSSTCTAGTTGSPGWSGTVPACGDSGTFITGCAIETICDAGVPCFNVCLPASTTRTQTCR